jgi:hypothetical protein
MTSRRGIFRLLAATASFAAAVLLRPSPASALAVNPFFAGSTTVDWTHPLANSTVIDGQLDPIFGQSSIAIDIEHGMVDDGGTLGGPLRPSDFSNLAGGFDYRFWGPLISNIDFSLGGSVTYGFPAAGVFAVSWVDVVNRDDHAIRNTFQVVFVGTSGYHTNGGIEIAPGSVIFAYGSPTDPRGTVNLSDASLAAIAINSPSFATLNSLGIGAADGQVFPADVAALQSSGDPFLFGRETSGFAAPIAFDSIAESLPEPACAALLGLGVISLLGRARRG